MIPFWKKTDKGGKKPPKPAVPHTAQQSIPMQRMFEDGTCRVKPNYYTRTIAYQDINYQLAQQEDKTAIFEEWCSFLNFFDSSIKFELSFVNMATDSSEFEKSIRIPYQRDGFDDVRAEYSQMLRQQLAKGNNGLTKTKFITFGVEGESMKTVKTRLDHVQNDLLNNFHRLGVQAKPLNGEERLKLMHDMLNMSTILTSAVCTTPFTSASLPRSWSGMELVTTRKSRRRMNKVHGSWAAKVISLSSPVMMAGITPFIIAIFP